MISQKNVFNTVRKAIDALGDIASEFTLNRDTSTFNPLTSEMEEITESVSGKGVLDTTNTLYLDESTQSGEYVYLWLLLPEIVSVDDEITSHTGDIYRVVKVDSYKSVDNIFLHRIGLAK